MKCSILRIFWIIALSTSVFGWIILAVSQQEASWLDADGLLHEPLFWLIPVSYFLLFLAVVLAALELLRGLISKRKNRIR